MEYESMEKSWNSTEFFNYKGTSYFFKKIFIKIVWKNTNIYIYIIVNYNKNIYKIFFN